MYISKHHRLNDQEAIFTLMDTYPLGAWVLSTNEGLVANHIPFYLDRGKGPLGTLVGHVSRANSVWRELSQAPSSVVMFQGPQAYITPGWYPGKAEHGKVVPTWNYAVAHAHGAARAIEDRAWMLDMLNQLTTVHEANQVTPWQVGAAPADYINKMLNAIVGIEIRIDRLEGKLKASQDEDMEDRLGTVRGLQQVPGEAAKSMADLVNQVIQADSSD